MGIQIPLLVIGQRAVSVMIPEPVGSTHLRFGDARVVEILVCGNLKVVRSPACDPGRHEEFRNGPEVKIYIWEVLFWPPENVRDFSVLYREGSRRFRSGAHLHGGTHMNVGSGGKAPHPWSRRTKIPL